MWRSLVIILLQVFLGCSRYIYTQHARTVRYEVCTSSNDCATIVITGNSLPLSVSIYGAMGVKLMSFTLSSDSVELLYVYNNDVSELIHRMFSKTTYSYTKDFFLALVQGFNVEDMNGFEKEYCDGGLCIRYYIQDYVRHGSTIVPKSVQIIFGGYVLQLKRL